MPLTAPERNQSIKWVAAEPSPFQVLYRETATKCMVCEEQNRTVTLSPCNHYVVCSTCAPNQRECPYCQTPVVSTI